MRNHLLVPHEKNYAFFPHNPPFCADRIEGPDIENVSSTEHAAYSCR